MISPLPTIKVLLKEPPKDHNDEELFFFFYSLPYTTEAAAETSPTFPPYLHSFVSTLV